MNQITGSETKYILVQTNTETEHQQAVFYNEYNNSLTPVDPINQASKFDDLDMLQQIASLQNQMAVLFKKPYTYSVVKEEINRTEVEE